MGLPSELMLDFLQYLNKADLKHARLVCKDWSGCASEHLFAKLFISPHKLNLQVFNTVAQDRTLSKCVKELEYDAIHFSPDITMSEYFELLWSQTSMVISDLESVFKHPDPEIRHFITIRRDFKRYCRGFQDREDLRGYWPGSQDTLAEVRMICCEFAFVQEGYKKWMDQAAFEKNYSEGTALLKILIHGLRNFGRLETVKLRGEWPSRGDLSRQGSPLARSWHSFHAHPRGWVFGPDQPLEQFIACKDFWTLAFALSEARKIRIRTFLIQSTLPPTAFVAKLGGKHTRVDRGIAAYSGLENLKLSLAGYPDKPMIELYENLHGLHRMLESMTALKRFELDLPDDVNDIEALFSYTKVFPENGHWPQLTTFAVRNLAIGTKDLITLLITKMPSLRHLTFGDMMLLDGQWEGIVEYIRVAKRLSSFKICLESELFHHGADDYLLERPRSRYDPIHLGRRDFITAIQDYVVNWWKKPTLKHPSLFPRQRAQSSHDYLHEVFRLCGMHAMGGTINELAKHMLNEKALFVNGKSTGSEETPLEICSKAANTRG